MATAARRTLADSLRLWVPPHSILGRVLFPLLEERRSLPAVLTWMGLGTVVAFVLIAFLAPCSRLGIPMRSSTRGTSLHGQTPQSLQIVRISRSRLRGGRT